MEQNATRPGSQNCRSSVFVGLVWLAGSESGGDERTWAAHGWGAGSGGRDGGPATCQQN